MNNTSYQDKQKIDYDLRGRVCPFPVVAVLKIADALPAGQEVCFVLDDPQAIKSIPEELEDDDELTICVTKHEKYWQLIIKKGDEA